MTISSRIIFLIVFDLPLLTFAAAQNAAQASDSKFAQYGEQLGLLAATDFDRARNLADKFARIETRLSAQLILGQSALNAKIGFGETQFRLVTGDQDEWISIGIDY